MSVAYPVTVVQDSPTETQLYLQPGTPVKKRVRPNGTPIPRDMPYAERARLPHVMGDSTWTANHALVIMRPHTAHSVMLFWREADWEFMGWYANLQAPVTRVSVGFDTADHVLDLVITPSLDWSWKDEHEFAEAVRIGRFTPLAAAEIQAEGARVIATVEARHWTFDPTLATWRPDPDWDVPGMPANWNDED